MHMRITVLIFSMALVFALLPGCKKSGEAATETKTGGVRIVSLDNPNIHVFGAAYISRTPGKLTFKRFSANTVNAPNDSRRFPATNALSTSGISIQFKTRSSSFHMTFTSEAGMDDKGSFKVLKDGIDFKIVSFEGPLRLPVQIELTDLPTDKDYIYEIILPSYTNVSLTKLELDGVSDLMSYTPAPKGLYMSFGDSITHGSGQEGCSYLTYPFLLAQKLNMNLYNLGISGARISMPIAEMSKELPKADIITILIGFNDFSSGNRTATQIESDYRAYLTEIRKNQPLAEIFCITLLHTDKVSNTTTGLLPNHVRNIVKNIVTEYQVTDSKLHIVEGDKIIPSTDYLIDHVHLNIEGASVLANGLYQEITN